MSSRDLLSAAGGQRNIFQKGNLGLHTPDAQVIPMKVTHGEPAGSLQCSNEGSASLVQPDRTARAWY